MKTRVFPSLLFLLLNFACIHPLSADILNVVDSSLNPSCALADVQNTIASAHDGDTIVLAASTCVWSSKLSFARGITLQGAGCATDEDGRAVAPCQTVIQDNSAGGKVPMISWTCVTGRAHRLTGIQFQNGGRQGFSGQAAVFISCPTQVGTTVRVDHNVFDHVINSTGPDPSDGKQLGTNSAVGVIDHNTFLAVKDSLLFYGSNWDGIGAWGDESWHAPVIWGSGDFMFVEDNTFVIDSFGSCTDAYGGARFVIRFNRFVHCNSNQHGTDSTGRTRATRAVEDYANSYDERGTSRAALHAENRDGDLLLWGNTGQLPLGVNPFAAALRSYRSYSYFAPWGQQDGTNPWDVNDPNNPYDPGAACPEKTCTATDAGTLTVSVSGAAWTPNQWTGFIILKLNCTPSNGNGCAAPIASNTPNQITFLGSNGEGTSLHFSAGDTFQINKVLAGMDQPGRSQGDLISGAATSPERPTTWNDQVNLPSMQWLNKNAVNGSNLLFAVGPDCPGCVKNVNYLDYEPAKTFDGTIAPNRSSIGVGTLGSQGISNVFPTCSTGVAFWAIDQGNWNAGTNLLYPGQGVLYQCTNINTWTLAYTPYTYPHPLIGGASAGTTNSPFSIPNLGGFSQTSAGNGVLSVGYAAIQVAAGTAPSGYALVSFRQNGILISDTSVSASPLIQSGRIYAEIGGPVNTGLAIANPNNQTANISFFFTDQNGANFGAGTTTIPAFGQIANFLSDPTFNSGGTVPVLGTFTFSSDVPIAATALRGRINERNDFLITTLPVGAVSTVMVEIGQSSLFPYFADGGGWASKVVLVNPTDLPITGTLQFTGQGSATAAAQPAMVTVNGQPMGVFAYTIPARSAWTLQTSGQGQDAQEGSVQLMPDPFNPSPSGLIILSFQNLVATVAEASIPASPTDSAFRTYAEASGTWGQVGSIESGVAVTNASATPVSVNFELSTLAGSSTGLPPLAQYTLPANGQAVLFLNQIPGFAALSTPFKGVLRVSSSSGPISVIGLRGHYNERSDFLITTLPAIDENTPSTATELLFPQLVDGGGYTTQFILFSGSAGQSSSGSLLLFSQTGQPLTLLLLP